MGVNAGSSVHNGLELTLRYHLVRNERLRMQLFSSGTLTDHRFREFIHNGYDYSGNLLPGIPASSVNAGIDLAAASGFYGNVNYQFVDRMMLRDDNSVLSSAYSLLNFKAGYARVFFGRLEADLFLGVGNLLDEHYASMHLVNAVSFGGSAPRYYYPGLPRNWFSGFSLSFSL
jgi:iron complex outermembrane receptor protein